MVIEMLGRQRTPGLGRQSAERRVHRPVAPPFTRGERADEIVDLAFAIVDRERCRG